MSKDHCVRVSDIGGLGTRRTSGLLREVLPVMWNFDASLQTKEESKKINAFLLYGQYNAGASLERTFTLSLCFVGLSYATKAFFPTTTLQCSSTDSVSSIRVAPRMFGVHSICTRNMISTSCSRLR